MSSCLIFSLTHRPTVGFFVSLFVCLSARLFSLRSKSKKKKRECFAPPLPQVLLRHGSNIRIQKILSTGVCTQRALTHSASVSVIRTLNAFFQQSIAASIFHILNHHCSPKLKFKKKIEICVIKKIGNHIFYLTLWKLRKISKHAA